MSTKPRGIIAFFAGHRVAGNLVLMLMLLIGLFGLTKLNRQIIPTFVFDTITIAVQWPGSSPEDVEDNIIDAIEREVRFLDNVDQVESVAYSGRADVQVQYDEGSDMAKALSDAQSAIAVLRVIDEDLRQANSG